MGDLNSIQFNLLNHIYAFEKEEEKKKEKKKKKK